ncbi:MAG: hypothetical protein ACYCOU_11630 [Sulfobacillus sp.]
MGPASVAMTESFGLGLIPRHKSAIPSISSALNHFTGIGFRQSGDVLFGATGIDPVS